VSGAPGGAETATKADMTAIMVPGLLSPGTTCL